MAVTWGASPCLGWNGGESPLGFQMSCHKQNMVLPIHPGLDIAEVPHRLAEQEIAPDDKGKEDVAKDDDQEKDLNNSWNWGGPKS